MILFSRDQSAYQLVETEKQITVHGDSLSSGGLLQGCELGEGRFIYVEAQMGETGGLSCTRRLGVPIQRIGAHPPYDAELVPALDAISRQNSPIPTADLRARRIACAALSPSVETLQRNGAFEINERRIAGPSGAPDLSVLICRPADVGTRAPAIYYVHGGGMVMGDNRTGLDYVLDWAEQLGMFVLSVEYRLAPENPHPAPIEDCYAGLVWTATHGTELGVDAGRVLLVGKSAGGGLAAAVALLARDRGGPFLIGQMLMCPMLDDRNETPSSYEGVGDGLWDRPSNLMGWTALLGDEVGGPDVSPYAAPAHATELTDLPPTFIDVGSVEIFRDEAVQYASRIWQARGTAELHVWPGGFHGFYNRTPDVAVSRAAREAQTGWIKRLLEG